MKAAYEACLAKRMSGLAESVTLKLNTAVQARVARGEDIVNLTAGEPDFWVPNEIKEAAIRAVRENKSRYTPAAGITPLREKIAEKTNRQQPTLAHVRPWSAADVVVTNGGKQALFNSFLALLDAGDEVLIPTPAWLSYSEMARVAGGVPVRLTTTYEEGFRLTPEKLIAALEAQQGKVKAIVFCSPSNPTGAIYSQEEFQRLARVLAEHPLGRHVWVLSDEIYDRITFGETTFCSFLEAAVRVAPELRERTVTINGLSKSAALTGWRVGWAVASQKMILALNNLQGQSSSGINSVAQWASLAAFEIPDAQFTPWIDAYRKRRDRALEILKKPGKLKITSPEGAFYIWLGVEAYLKKDETSVGFCERVLDEARVALVPGGPFGDETSVRISFSTELSVIEKGCERLSEFLSRS